MYHEMKFCCKNSNIDEEKMPISLQPKPAIRKGDRTFDGQIPKGGHGIGPSKCAILFIEFQNEFTTKVRS